MANEYRVQVRPHALTGEHRGEYGRATYIGLSWDGKDVYRVVFGAPGHEVSAKILADDLTFMTEGGFVGQGERRPQHNWWEC